MIFPTVKVIFGDKISEVLPSKEILFKRKVFIFVKKEQPLLRNISQLEGKKVELIFGFPYAAELLNNKKIEFDSGAKTGIDNTRKLQSGRFDAIVMEENSALKAIKEVGVDIQYDHSSSISVEDVFVGFHQNERGRMLEEKFSKGIRELKEDGTFTSIMGKLRQ